MFSGKTYWIVGASEGLGRALAKSLSNEGAKLVVSARSEERLKSLADKLPNARCVVMDVCDKSSVEVASQQVGEIDGLIYCAGAYDPIGALDWQNDKVLRMADVNFQGALRVLGEVMPSFSARKSGHIVLIGSLAGFSGLPQAVGYGASKSALMHLAENIKADVARTDIQVQVVNPGFIKTRLTDKNDFDMPSIMEPDQAATAVVNAMKSGRFSTSFPRPFSWIFKLSRFVPLSLFHRIVVR
ncbi:MULTISPECIES: SDR family NAD(P)-dependent oxidoreductase [Halocynthiibacter]|uniref:SDR family NAD(P)-dependent oxidoreductase n=1 Tax=Halocynthiibacter halioticoli TaxID=2986804 RepID=A0AAE3IVU3_9RHOB|nr:MULTISPECIES: SDR family NAD(P)-dependent oxidoreductase [Halocynthiibacter]MCV6823102.1 SDR family NAD(P)-dependent oxidoreductase [Halocynthiibacter halioticoli]MCW4056103.1 SDR family NAD(P)-dependent oxidoreductase [Halocynthiibacter sp. SDUM655004]